MLFVSWLTAPWLTANQQTETAQHINIVHTKDGYQTPIKSIKSPQQLQQWKQSTAYYNIMKFILQCNEQIKGQKINDSNRQQQHSKPITDFLTFLTTAKQWIIDIPPQQQSQRFGNKSFRTWLEKLHSELPNFLKQLLPTDSSAAIEIQPILEESFGNKQRIDYGTGHELNFIIVLCMLSKIGVFNETDYVSLVLDIFVKYLELMEELQLVYWLEPAG